MRPRLPDEEFGHILAAIKQCRYSRSLADTKRLRSQLGDAGHDCRTTIGNSLVQLFGICGSIGDARLVFERITTRNEFSWNILITAYAQTGHLREAVETFHSMSQWNVVSWNSVIAALVQKGQVREAGDYFRRCPQRDAVTWNSLVAAYGRCGHLDKAQKLLSLCPEFHVVSWTAIVAAYADGGRIQEAKEVFDAMPEQDVVLRTIMLTAYARRGQLHEAREMFDAISCKDAGAWSMMLLAYAGNRDFEQAKKLFDSAPHPSLSFMNTMILAYAEAGHIAKAKALFDSMKERDVISWTTMLTAYGRDGDLVNARRIFDQMPASVRDAAAWSAMVAAYAQGGQPEKALSLFLLMDLDGHRPTPQSFVSAIDACTNIPSVQHGRMIHAEAAQSQHRGELELVNAAMAMYGSFGYVEEAKLVFDGAVQRDAISWTAMLTGYARSGYSQKTLDVYRLMLVDGTQPDGVTFINLLSGCSHSGLVLDGLGYFMAMNEVHGIQPSTEHFDCVVDLLGRAGSVTCVEELIGNMPFQPTRLAWQTMVSACRLQGDVAKVGFAARNAMLYEPKDSALYVLVSAGLGAQT